MAINDYAIPRANAPLVRSDTTPTTEWYNYLHFLGISIANAGSVTPPVTPSGNIIGIDSIRTYGALPGTVEIYLQGDSLHPGNTYYYGTGPTGTKGFNTVASAFLGTTGDITLTTASNGVTTIDLASITQRTDGVLTAIALDTKGRVVQSHAVTVTGTVNQVIVTGGTGSGATIGLATPQDIAVTSSPSFAAVNLANDPTTALEAATKQYVDNAIAGLSPKAPALAATTGNITLSGLQTIDGISLVAGNRCLVWQQTTQANNGIYVVASGAWTRSLDMDTWAEVPGSFLFVLEGTVNGDKGYVCTSDPGGTLGTTPINFVPFTPAPSGVTSVALSLPAQFVVTGSPVTTAGTLIGSWANQTKNLALLSPVSSTGVPTFRSITLADIPQPDLATLWMMT